MGVNTQKYIRKPLIVEAIRVTAKNFDDVVAWCQGEVQTEEVGRKGTLKKYIRVRVHNPKSPRQTKAFIGDWILYTERGYKVYKETPFQEAFDKYEEPVQVQVTPEEICEKLPNVQDRRPTAPPQDEKKTHEPPLPEPPVIEPGADLGTTPQGEPHEYVNVTPHEYATPQAIADAVNEQQPSIAEGAGPGGNEFGTTGSLGEGSVPEPDAAGGPGSRIERNAMTAKADVPMASPKPGDDQDHWEKISVGETPQPKPVTEQPPEDAAAGKMVLSEAEQKQLGPDGVRELLQTGDAILAQDLA